jgi:hypothetical protein
MTSSHRRHLGRAACLVAVALAVAGCGGSGAGTGATKDGAAGSTHAGSTLNDQKVGGGHFCDVIAQSLKKPTVSGGDARAKVATARADGQRALAIAPAAIKADMTTLIAASDRMYDALDKVHYDYSKLTAADLAPMSTKDVSAAEQRLMAYTKNTCGLDLTNAAGASPTSAASSSTADLAGATGGSACKLATVEQISAAAGKPVALSGGTDAICAYSATSDPGLFVYVQIYADKHSMAAMTQLEGVSQHVAGLGDDAFWAGPAGVVFVRKGDRAFSVSAPSLANLTARPDAMKKQMVTLARQALTQF